MEKSDTRKTFIIFRVKNKVIYIASLAGTFFSLFQMYKFFYPNKKVEIEEVETNEIEEQERKKQTSIDTD